MALTFAAVEEQQSRDPETFSSTADGGHEWKSLFKEPLFHSV